MMKYSPAGPEAGGRRAEVGGVSSVIWHPSSVPAVAPTFVLAELWFGRQLLVGRPTMRPFIRNHFLPLWLHRIACGVFVALILALGGMSFLGRVDGSWRHLIALCLIILSIPVGLLCACMAHRFSIVEGVAGDVGYEDLDESKKSDEKSSA